METENDQAGGSTGRRDKTARVDLKIPGTWEVVAGMENLEISEEGYDINLKLAGISETVVALRNADVINSRQRRCFGSQSRQEGLDRLRWALHNNLDTGVSQISHGSGKLSLMGDSIDERAESDALHDTAYKHAAAFDSHFESVSAAVCTVKRSTNSSLPVCRSTSDWHFGQLRMGTAK